MAAARRQQQRRDCGGHAPLRGRHAPEGKAGRRGRARSQVTARETRVRTRIFCSTRPSAFFSSGRPSRPSCYSSSALCYPGTLPGCPLATLSAANASLAPPQPSIRRRTATRPSQSPEGASPLFFIFLMALGGLGAILLSAHPSLSPSHVLSQVDLRSVFLAVVFLIIVLVLGAYLLLRILSCGSSRCLGCRWFPLVSLPCPHAFAGSD